MINDANIKAASGLGVSYAWTYCPALFEPTPPTLRCRISIRLQCNNPRVRPSHRTCCSQRNAAFRSAAVSKTHDASLIAEVGIFHGSRLLFGQTPAFASLRPQASQVAFPRGFATLTVAAAMNASRFLAVFEDAPSPRSKTHRASLICKGDNPGSQPGQFPACHAGICLHAGGNFRTREGQANV